jgi:hypothetical protein
MITIVLCGIIAYSDEAFIRQWLRLNLPDLNFSSIYEISLVLCS